MGQAILVSVAAGCLMWGVGRAGHYTGVGIIKIAHVFHHHVNQPVAKVSKAIARHEVKTQ